MDFQKFLPFLFLILSLSGAVPLAYHDATVAATRTITKDAFHQLKLFRVSSRIWPQFLWFRVRCRANMCIMVALSWAMMGSASPKTWLCTSLYNQYVLAVNIKLYKTWPNISQQPFHFYFIRFVPIVVTIISINSIGIRARMATQEDQSGKVCLSKHCWLLSKFEF